MTPGEFYGDLAQILATVDSKKIPMETKEIVLTKLSVLYEDSSSYKFG